LSAAGPARRASAAFYAAGYAIASQQFADCTGFAVNVSRTTLAFVSFRVAFERVALGGIAIHHFAAVGIGSASHVTDFVKSAVETIVTIRYARQALDASVD
jgi:hypothetical protein